MPPPPLRLRLLHALDLLQSLAFSPASHARALQQLEGMLAEVALGEAAGEEGSERGKMDAFLTSQEGFETNSEPN